MPLDSRFTYAPSLEMLFNDKATAEPMAAGIVTFFSDIDRDQKKAVYQITGNPPNYTYTALDNPIILNADGSFSDNEGNNVIPYYYPFTGTPDENTGIEELYYITVTNADLEPQFTREGWPNVFGSADNSSTTLTNYVPNGQLLAHNDVPFVTGNQVGQLTVNEFNFAPNGYYFVRSSGASTDLLNYQRNGSYSEDPTGSPRYSLRLQCTIAASNTKQIQIRFLDVNKFASGTLNYTFAFNAISNDESDIPVTATFLKNFGTGGSPNVLIPIPLNEPTITADQQQFYGSFIPGSNASYTIGTLDDDYCALVINLPSNANYDLLFTDFILTVGRINSPSFPVTTNAKFMYQGPAGGLPTPAADGSDLYLPIIYKQNGFAFDDGDIGKVYTSTDNLRGVSTTTNEIGCDGTKLIAEDYSPLGIPYSRLQTKLFSSGALAPAFGTGLDYVICPNPALDSASPEMINFHNNTLGGTSATADGPGGSATGFAFQTTCTGTAGYAVKAYESAVPGVTYSINNDVGAVTAPTSGTSTIPVVVFRTGAAATQNMFYIDVAASAVTPAFLAGKYLTFSSNAAYYVWFKNSGSGSDPAPGGTGILVNLNGDDNLVSIARKIQSALNGFQASSVQTTGITATSLQNKYWTFFATGSQYFVWYNLDSAGVKPAGTGTAIEVDIATGDTASQIATKTVIAINSYSYQVPDFRGYYLKGYDETLTVNLGAYYTNIPNGWLDIAVGSIGLDSNLSHFHTITQTPEDLFGFTDGGAGVESGTGREPHLIATATDYEGSLEVDVKNILVNYVIKY